jgi:hypothetical protein
MLPERLLFRYRATSSCAGKGRAAERDLRA